MVNKKKCQQTIWMPKIQILYNKVANKTRETAITTLHFLGTTFVIASNNTISLPLGQ